VATGIRNNQISSRVLNVIVTDVRQGARAPAVEAGIAKCSQKLIEDAVQSFRLISQRTKTITDLEEEAIRRATGAQRPAPDLARDDVNAVIKVATLNFAAKAKALCPKEMDVDELSLGLVVRICNGLGQTSCSKDRSIGLGDNVDTARFRQIFTWALQYLPKDTRDLKANVTMLLARDDISFEKIKTNVQGGLDTPGFDWPPEQAAETQREELEALVKRLRQTRDEKKRFIDAIALRTISLPRNLGAQILDVLARPSSPLSKLLPDDKVSFGNISNELARSRLSECYFLRQKSSDLAELAKCSGFALPNKEILTGCINGGRCVPQWNEKAYRIVSLINTPTSLGDLLNKNDLPRVFAGKLGDDINAINRCRIGPDTSIENCILSATLPPESKRIWGECMQGGKRKDWQTIGPCIASTNPQLTNVTNCVKNIRSGASTEERATAALECVGGSSLPKPAKILVTCIQQAGKDNAALVACGLGESGVVSPKTAQAVGCVVQSQGDPWGVALCSAGDQMNAETKIAIQCAMSSGGNPAVFGGCAIGRLTFKELQQCVGGKFGVSPCFGDGNEFQKLAKALFGAPISSESVLGQLITVDIKAYEAAIVLVQNGIREVSRFVNDATREIGIFGENAGREADVLGKNINREVINAGHVAERAVQDVGKGVEHFGQEVGKVFGVRL